MPPNHLKSNLEKQQHLLSWRASLVQLHYLPKALKLVWLAAPGWTAATLVSLVVQGVLPVAIVLLTRHLVDSLVALIGNRGDATLFYAALLNVLTGSLHGAILAQAYGVPWAAYDDGYIDAPPKWLDWAAYLGIPITFVADLKAGMRWWQTTGVQGSIRDTEPLLAAFPYQHPHLHLSGPQWRFLLSA